MEGTRIARDQEVAPRTSRVRVAAGIAVLALIAVLAGVLAPPYYENWRLQRFLTALAQDPASIHRSPELLQALVVDRAAGRLGLPVRTGDVHIAMGANGLKIEVLYVVHIDLPVYTVDLHFRPGA